MEGHLSASIATCGEKLATTTIMCAFITNRESLARAVARLSSVLLSLNAARIFVQIVRNLHRCEESRCAIQGDSRKTESYTNRCWNFNRLTPLESKCKRNIAPVITSRMLIERLVTSLEMYNRCSRCASNTLEIFGNPRKYKYG